MTDLCIDCKSRNVVEGYVERKFIPTMRGKKLIQIKKWCQDCLTEYANKQERRASYMPKLRDTKIDKYLEVVNDYDFIPYAFRWKTSSYYHEERAVTIKN